MKFTFSHLAGVMLGMILCSILLSWWDQVTVGRMIDIQLDTFTTLFALTLACKFTQE